MNYSAESMYKTAKVCERKTLRSANDAAAFFAKYNGKEQEHFLLATFDGANHLLKIHCVFIGTINRCAISPREIFRKILLDNAARFIIAHNHPSGTTYPSDEDKHFTRQIKEASYLMGVELLDHIIITKSNGFFSFAGNDIL